MLPEISVIISTRDRAEQLQACLEALVSQKGLAPRAYEVIVVDNGSSDHTAQVVEAIRQRSAQVRRLYEERPGLSIARNAGVRQAEGQIVCFTDDDAIPCPDYVAEILSSFDDPLVACVGGKVIASWPDGAPPDWFCPRYANVVAQTSFGQTPRRMKKGEFPFGCNIALRKQVFQSLGGFDENLGKKGQNNIWGEEIDLCLKLQAQGLRFFYNSRAIVSHVVGRNRATKHYFVESIFGKGVTEGHQKLAHRGRTVFAAYLLLKAGRLAATSLYYLAARPLLSDAARFRLRCVISWCAGYLYFLAVRNDFGSIPGSPD
jgi:glycosyltransferase involved in cell wall biosynthesis